MSEFKFACPVCGQHIKCDSSQAGTVMDCPTCFQKINVPQAPTTDEQKFILTGTKVSERPTSVYDAGAAVGPAAAKRFPGVLVVVIIFLFMGSAAAAIYWATIIHPRTVGLKAGPSSTNAAVASKPKPPTKPPLVAPPSSDSNWTLLLGTNAIPDSPAAGRIHAQDFIVERAQFQNGNLTLRWGPHGATDLSAVINFSGALPEELAEKIINVTTNAEKAAPVTLRWKDANGKMQHDTFDAGYALRLEFASVANNHMRGKIYLCAPDQEKSYLFGTFNADTRKPKPKGKPNSPPAH